MIKKSNGRPPKITIGTMDKIADAIQNNYNVTDAWLLTLVGTLR